MVRATGLQSLLADAGGTRKIGRTGIDMFSVEDDAFELRLDEVICEGWQSPKQ